METVKRSSNNVIEFLQSEGYLRFRADSEASSKAIYEAYTRSVAYTHLGGLPTDGGKPCGAVLLDEQVVQHLLLLITEGEKELGEKTVCCQLRCV